MAEVVDSEERSILESAIERLVQDPDSASGWPKRRWRLGSAFSPIPWRISSFRMRCKVTRRIAAIPIAPAMQPLGSRATNSARKANPTARRGLRWLA